MKTIVFYAFLIFFVLYSCKEPESLITFSVPQPEGKNNLKEFPENIWGVYKNYDTQEELTIKKNMIISVKLISDTLPMSYKDSLKDEKVLNSYYQFKQFKTLKNDSLLVTYKVFDTIFNANKNVLKKFKGYYFLNFQIDSSKWNVKKLSFNRNIINLHKIETINELKTMKDIMLLQTKDSTESILVKPNKKQFKEFINANGFEHGDSYLKIK